MPRKVRNDLSYFTLDCDIFSGKSRLAPLISRFNGDGFILYVHILCDVYSTGYYFRPDNYEDYLYQLAKDCGISVNKVKLIIAFMSNRSLLDANCLNKNTVFTSHGIQKRYAEAMKGRKRSIAEIRGEHWLLTEREEQELDTFYKSHPFSNKSENNGDKSENNGDKSEIYSRTEQNRTKQNITDIVDEDISNILRGVVFDCAPIYSRKEYELAQNALMHSSWARANLMHLSKIHRNWDKLISGYYKDRDDNPSVHIATDYSADRLNEVFGKLNEEEL